MLPTLLALAVIVSGDGTTGGSPTNSGGGSASHSSHSGAKSHSKGRSRSGGTDNAGSRTGGSGSAGAGSAPGPHIVPTGGGSGRAGGPVAYFVATSPVAPGAPVAYTDESYDTTLGASILSRTWQGRRSSFAHPGVYTVSLTVTDSYGRRSAYTAQVLVSGTTASAPSGKPHAFFLVTSPVPAGTAVQYTDESYDLELGAHIVNEIWSGRQASFAVPGSYPVTLKVEDSTGAWSGTFRRDVVVTSAPATTGNGTGGQSSSPPPAWSAQAAPDPAAPGAVVTVTASAPPGAVGAPELVVPSALRTSWDGVSYTATNASGVMAATAPGEFTRTLRIPDSASFPSGAYPLTVLPPDGAQAVTVTLVVHPATSYVEPIVSGT